MQRAYNELLAAACGVTTFVQLQHLSACKLIATGENEALKERLLPDLAAGRRLAGVAFAHLRRPGPPVLRAEADASGFRFNGTAPWMTGWGLMDEVVLGGTLPDGRLLYVVAPLVASDALQPSPPLRLAAMNASATVSLTCRDLHVPRERYLKTITLAEMGQSDREAILSLTPLPFGAATSAIRLVRELAQERADPLLNETADALERELAGARRGVDSWVDRTAEPQYEMEALGLRAWAIELGVRAAHAAVAATSGTANLLAHPAQRLLREALAYTVGSQTPSVQSATLQRLATGAMQAAAEGEG